MTDETRPEEADPVQLPARAETPVEATLRWMTDGHDETAILDALAAKFPGKNPKPIIENAVRELQADGAPDPLVVRGLAMRAYRQLYRKCLEIGDFDGARKIVKEMTALAK